jgi:hypothetical protein
MTWAALRLLAGGWLKAAGKFVAANWRWLLPLAAALLLWWYIAHLQGQRDDAIQALADYRAAAQAADEKRKAENAAKEEAVTRHFNQVLGEHAQELERIRTHYERTLKDDRQRHADAVNNWRERLRLEVAKAAAAGLPGLPRTAADAAESGGDRHPAAARPVPDPIAAACAVTTADYNALWQAWHDACVIHGCLK